MIIDTEWAEKALEMGDDRLARMYREIMKGARENADAMGADEIRVEEMAILNALHQELDERGLDVWGRMQTGGL